MSFASVDFLVFFACVLAGAFIAEHYCSKRAKECFLLVASYFFYGYWDWRFCFLLLFITLVSFLAGKNTEKKPWFITGIVIPLVVLGLFKYFNFFLSSMETLMGHDIGLFKIILPVGISFYTFQALSYVIDVRRGKVETEYDFIRLALYLSFFPQLVAGPIIRASDLLPQFNEDRKVSFENIKYGIQIFTFGLFKKVVLADNISIFVDDVYSKPAAFHWATILLALLSYSIQIYFDFSGYSDMAVGCAKCLGYDFDRNFNLPYISQNVTEFWRRWHISLSTWLREYLYIPLGGNRRGKGRQYINLFLTMLLGGLWHGADWTFVFWGGLNGLALCIDKMIDRKGNRSRFKVAFSVVVTFIFVTFTWIFFRADSFVAAGAIIRGIFTLQNGIRQPFAWSFVAIILLFVSTVSATVRAKKLGRGSVDGYYPILNLDSIIGLSLFFIEIGLILGLAFTGENPFVYFQF